MNDKIELTIKNSIAYTNFESFKSTNLHRLHKTTPLKFIEEIKEKQLIENYLQNKRYLYANYLFALCNYLIKRDNLNIQINSFDIHLTKRYVFPTDTYVKAYISKDNAYLYDAYYKAIPEFLKYKIIEVSI